MNRSTRIILVIGLMLAGLAPSTAPARSSQGPERQTLGGLNIIKGTKAASIPVRLTEPAKVFYNHYGEKADFKVKRASGSFVGAVLVSEDFDFEDDGSITGRAILAGAVPGRENATSVIYDYTRTGRDDEGSLPAGNYRLYLLTNGKPASVSLRLHGLSGRKVVRPTNASDLDIESPAPEVDVGDNHNVYSAGSHAKLEREGLLFKMFSLDRPLSTVGFSQFCTRIGRPEPVAHPLMWGPGCPSLNDRLLSISPEVIVDPTTHYQTVTYGGAIGRPGVYGQGVYMTSAALVDELAWTGIWLSLD